MSKKSDIPIAQEVVNAIPDDNIPLAHVDLGDDEGDVYMEPVGDDDEDVYMEPVSAAASAPPVASLRTSSGIRSHPFMRQNSSDAKIYIRGNDRRARASRCRPEKSRPIPIDNDVPTYIIVSHGGYIGPNTTMKWTPQQVKQARQQVGMDPTLQTPGRNGLILENIKSWEGISFGVLVPEDTTLISSIVGTDSSGISGIQRGAIDHIQGIISGNIKVFQRYPWKVRVQGTDLVAFPNLVFKGGLKESAEGVNVHDSFIETIVRVHKGNVRHAALVPSFRDPKFARTGALAWFWGSGAGRGIFYPGNTPLSVLNASQVRSFSTNNQIITLREILSKLRMNSEVVRAREGGRPGFNVVFATCLEGLPREIHDLWIGRNRRRRVLPRGDPALPREEERGPTSEESAAAKSSKKKQGGKKKNKKRKRKKRKSRRKKSLKKKEKLEDVIKNVNLNKFNNCFK